MRVPLGDKELHIRFATDDALIMTTCVVAEDKQFLRILDVGVTMRSRKDDYRPDVARKISLSRAIKELPRPQRFVVWERYMMMYQPKALKSFYRDAESAKDRQLRRGRKTTTGLPAQDAAGIPGSENQESRHPSR